MEGIGPPIESLTRRLAETPDDFLASPVRKGERKPINVPAVVSDLLRDIGGRPLTETHAKELKRNETERQLTTILITTWLLHDDWFLGREELAEPIRTMILRGDLAQITDLVEPRLFVTDADRREELARLCLDKIGLRPAGESATVARDRMTTLSSVERERVLTETREAQKRIQKIQEAMKRKKAQEAAPAWGRE